MYDEQQERPPWLRNLRPPDEVETQSTRVSDTHQAEAGLASPDLSLESSPGQGRGLNRRNVLMLAILLWTNIAVLGCLCLLATQRIVP